MSFVLRVTQGAGQGEEFALDGEAKLGRTADNDVVIKDPSSSRSHARVFEKDGQYFVEDLKSANGTLLNQVAIKLPRPLKHGDLITIGDVSLEFTLPEDPGNATMLNPPDEEGQDPNATMLRPALVAKVAESKAGERAVRKMQPRPSAPPPAQKAATLDETDDAPGPELPADDGSTRAFEVPPPKALAKKTSAPAEAPVRAAPPERAVARAPKAAEPEVAISAAEKARQRRELQKSSAGRLRLLWNDLPKPARIGASIMAGVVGLSVLGGLVYVVIPHKTTKLKEPNELVPNAAPIKESFGTGPDVDFERPDMKAFSFVYASPTRAVGVLHYQSKGISRNEVTIELNGSEVGTIPADVLDSDTREQEAILAAAAVKLGEPNQLVFDNVNNPPNDDAWKIWNIWVEITPVPEMSADDAARRAKEDMDKASKFYEQRGVGAENLFRAWKGYRDAWLLLEATPNKPQALDDIARTRMREIRPELDRKCSGFLVQFQKVINTRNPDIETAKKILADIPNSFPTREHPCNNLARQYMSMLNEDLQVGENL